MGGDARLNQRGIHPIQSSPSAAFLLPRRPGLGFELELVLVGDTAVSWELGREGFPLASNCARSRVLPGPGLGFQESWTGVEAPPEPFSIRRFGDDVKIAGFYCPEKQGAESWTGKCRATTSGRGSVFHTHHSALGGPGGLG